MRNPAPSDLTAFRAEVAAWLAKHCPAARDWPIDPFVGRDDASIAAAREVQAQLLAAGLGGITWPAEFGGRGGTVLEQLVFEQEALGYELPTRIFAAGLHLAGPTLIAAGTREQQARYLGPTLRGEIIWSQLFSEPEAGSDLASIRTSAVPLDYGWLINGTKNWCSSAHIADVGLLPARTDPNSVGPKGLTYFIVDLRAPGVAVTPVRQLTGDYHFSTVELKDVRVGSDSLIGDVGDAWRIMQTSLSAERHASSSALSVHRDVLVSLARAVKPPVGSPGRRRLIEALVDAEVLRMVRGRVQGALARGEEPIPPSVGKLLVTRLMRRSAEVAVELQGPEGMIALDPTETRGGAWQRQLLLWPGFRLAGGADEIHRNLLAERVLGLPREPAKAKVV
jgi:alkylation response protein AidB-like acyl-CoA dehydrogenase